MERELFLESKHTVKNRSTGTVFYNIPDLMIRRSFAPGEIKRDMITGNELEHLTFIPGGEKLIKKYLVLSKDVIEALGLDIEPEYFYEESDVIELLNTGSYEQFLDCLDFAPSGVIDLIKKYAVDNQLNDMRKRQAIKDVTGFDISRAIENVKYANGKDEEVEVKTRRVSETAKTEAPARRYNVTSRGK